MAYRYVRSLARGLKILAELNRAGRGIPSEIANTTGIDRTTVYRLLDTLEQEGFVGRAAADRFELTIKVRELSEGFTEKDQVAQIVAPELGRLLPKVLWPTDFGTFQQGAMIIRESTHRFSPFSTHRAMIGKSRPVLYSAMGRAVVAAATPTERNMMLRLIANSKQPDASQARDHRYLRTLLKQTRMRGYASSVGLVEPHISAIALPVRLGTRVVGAINLIFYSSAMTPEEAAKRYLSYMKESVATIEAGLAVLQRTGG